MNGCLRLLFVATVMLAAAGPGTSEARRSITWPPKRARESVLWPSPPSYSLDEVGDGDDDEPSCEELRAIWRLSKRAAQRSLLTNEVPIHPPPVPSSSRRGQYYGYMVRSPQLIKDGRPRQSFGRIVVDPSKSHPAPMTAIYGNGFDQVAEEMRASTFAEKPFTRVGVGVPGAATYGHVAYPTASPKLTYGKTRALYKPFTVAKPGPISTSRKPDKNQWVYKEPRPGKANPRKSPVYGRFDSPNAVGFNADTSACHDVAYKRCQVDEDCACYGLYHCVKGKCKTYTSSSTNKALSKWSSPAGTWHERPLLPSELGASPSSSPSSPSSLSSSSGRLNQKVPMRHTKHHMITYDRKQLLPDYGTWS